MWIKLIVHQFSPEQNDSSVQSTERKIISHNVKKVAGYGLKLEDLVACISFMWQIKQEPDLKTSCWGSDKVRSLSTICYDCVHPMHDMTKI